MKVYSKPMLAEYGTVMQMTHGTGGGKPDLIVVGNQLIDTDTNCSDPSTNTTACLIVDGS